MEILAAITTAPGREIPTIQRTSSSLIASGINPIIYEDNDQSGCWVSWVRALSNLLNLINTGTSANAIMICEDDVEFSPGLKEYLDLTLWPENPDKIALCSAYCPKQYTTDKAGWHVENRGWTLSMAQAWIIPTQSARMIYDEFKDVPEKVASIPRLTPENIRLYRDQINERILTDNRIGLWAQNNNLNVWYHTPSLSQHIASRDSIIGNNWGGDTLRQSIDYDPDATVDDLILRLLESFID